MPRARPSPEPVDRPDGSSSARWSVVLRALRGAAGATQAGWAARLGFGRSTLQRWERGDAPPSPDAEAALLKVCGERGLFRTFYQGPLRGITVSPELIRDLLAEARLSGAPKHAGPSSSVSAVLPARSPVGSALRAFRLALPRSSFVGRERDLTQVQALLGSNRLVSITGPGGAGKTRLALQVAATNDQAYPNGVWLVDLAPVSDPELVPQSLATALGIRDDGQQPVLAAALQMLVSARGLLVLDNCEHLLTVCAQVVDRLLAECSALHILATSRQPLGLGDEVCWPLAGLALPADDSAAMTVDQVSASEAVRLFVARAAAVRPGFAVNVDNAATLARICQRLDGLPLAIELAAARTRALAPAQLADRLDDHLRLLTWGNVIAAPRHQTLRATLDWSYDLLAPAERALLRRVSVFAGGWTLEAAEALAPDVGDVLDVLTSLVSKSLIAADLRADHARYRLLETVRQYATDKLDAAEEGATVRGAHLRLYLRMAETAEPHLRTSAQGTWLDQLEEDIENLRAALSWALGSSPTDNVVDQIGDGLRLAAALRWFWFTRGRPAEGRAWLERGLAVANGVPHAVRGRALDTAAALAHSQGAYVSARDFQEAALALWRAEADRRHTAAALSTLGIIAKAQGEHDQAHALLDEALVLAREVNDAATEATVLNNLAALAMDVGNYARARTFLQHSLAIKRELGDAAGIATSLYNLGDAAVHLGEYTSAVALLSESLALFRRLGASHRIAQTLHSLATVALRRGDLGAAEAQHAEALSRFRGAGDGWGQALCLEGLAEVAAWAGRHADAVRLFGAADAWRESNGAPVPPNDRADHARALATAAHSLGEVAFAVAWADGRAQSLEVVA
jgi:predicted ATPase/transcriptional regulator with XRE-family HTH domain